MRSSRSIITIALRSVYQLMKMVKPISKTKEVTAIDDRPSYKPDNMANLTKLIKMVESKPH